MKPSIVKKLVFFILIIAFFSTSCAGYPVKLESSKQPVDLASIDFSKGKQITASAGGFQLLLLIPININSRHKRAFEKLRLAAGDDYIADIKIQESWTYGFVGTAYTTTITATAYPRK
jgi:hypothetical protein